MRTFAWVVVIGACAGGDGDGDGGDGGSGREWVAPAGEPSFSRGTSADVEATFLGLPSRGAWDYDAHATLTAQGGAVLEDSRYVELRTYGVDDDGPGTLVVRGQRFRDQYEAHLRVADAGWVYRSNPIDGSWVPLWPTDPAPGDRWDALVTWYDLDPTTSVLLDGRSELVARDATAPDGTPGTAHLRSTFDAEGFTGTLDEYFLSGGGPVWEELVVTHPDGVLEAVTNTRRAEPRNP